MKRSVNIIIETDFPKGFFKGVKHVSVMNKNWFAIGTFKVKRVEVTSGRQVGEPRRTADAKSDSKRRRRS